MKVQRPSIGESIAVDMLLLRWGLLLRVCLLLCCDVPCMACPSCDAGRRFASSIGVCSVLRCLLTAVKLQHTVP